MTLALAVLQLVLLAVVLVLLLRRRDTKDDSRLAVDLSPQLARLDAQLSTLSNNVRADLAQIRTDLSTEAHTGREAADRSATALRTEVMSSVQALGDTLRSGLDSFRSDNAQGAETLRATVDQKLGALNMDFIAFTTDMAKEQVENREALHRSLNELRASQAGEQEKLRESVQQRLEVLRDSNEKKLEEMRNVVDEKLQKTLHSRLTESFGQVTDQLAKVHTGLGEMNTLSAGVSDLNRIFSNVKSRGGFAEVQLGKLLEQVLAPGQYVENARVKENSLEVVEFAVKFPGPTGGDVLLPIDAKFPREDWERLESAYEQGDQATIEQTRRAFDSAIRTEGKRICSKYINEPVTTPYAIMFLPTEGLYAEVLRRDGLQAELHQECRVMIAGPSNLYALLTSFQLGFRMLNLQKKGSEVWNVLARTQKEFKTFEGLMDSMEKQVGTVQNTIQKLGVRTRAINRTLRDVSTEADASLPGRNALAGVLPLLAAEDDE